jgi:hypothetical protein
VNSFDLRLVELAVRWGPFGGPSDEEIFESFGMKRDRFHEIVRGTLSSSGAGTDARVEPLIRHLPPHWGPEEITLYLTPAGPRRIPACTMLPGVSQMDVH